MGEQTEGEAVGFGGVIPVEGEGSVMLKEEDKEGSGDRGGAVLLELDEEGALGDWLESGFGEEV